ncbi:MAG: MgtC/SapB family protein [Myxococcales bacterium FL481]|nr:MAG: MgtC/SapB family protein [Myxococcales bacterium FL481]
MGSGAWRRIGTRRGHVSRLVVLPAAGYGGGLTLFLGSIDSQALLQIGLSLALGGAVGLEREARGRAAGLRTMMLVCLGATLVMIASGSIAQGGSAIHDPAVTRVDPARIAAGIVTGIGFLGAAVVVRLGDLIRGVTTAASIWLAAVLGIVIGAGQYALAVAATIAALVVLWLFHFLERVVPTPQYRRVSIGIHPSSSTAIHAEVLDRFRRRRIRVMDLSVDSSPDAREVTLTYNIRSRARLGALSLVQDVLAIRGVESCRWK